MFMEVWGMGADCILQCYCLDADISGSGGDGAGSFSKYTPVRLQSFISGDLDTPANREKMEAYKAMKMKAGGGN